MQCFYSPICSTINGRHVQGGHHGLPSQHGVRMSSEYLWIHHETRAIHQKRHFFRRLGVDDVTAKAHSTVSKPFRREGVMVPLIPTLEARAFDVFGKRHYVRELKICWLRGIVRWKV